LVVHVVNHLMMGGMENGMVNLINHLPHNEFRHAVVCVQHDSDFRDRIQRKDVPVFNMHRSKIGVMAMRWQLLRLFRRLRPAIVHSRNLSGLDALAPAWLAGVPRRVHSEHGWEVDNLHGKNWKPALLRRLNAPLVNRYVAVSQDLGNFLTTRAGVATRRISVICNGVDTERFHPVSSSHSTAAHLPDPSLAAPANFFQPGVVCVGTAGRLQAVKDQATLIAAVAHLLVADASLRSRLRLVIIGDGPLRGALQSQAQQAGIAELCWFTGASNQVPQCLRLLQVFVLPSLNEGISNTLLEAMASGLPTVVTPVGGNTELVEPGVTGTFFPVGDVAALAAVLAKYLAQPALAQQQGQAARARALDRFSLQAMVRNYRALYRGQLGLSA
jgi:sugar transferase (PEP-CTERM/EpsH1 system associated)